MPNEEESVVDSQVFNAATRRTPVCETWAALDIVDCMQRTWEGIQQFIFNLFNLTGLEEDNISTEDLTPFCRKSANINAN